jgi:starch synthase (maltosyl-transferring)
LYFHQVDNDQLICYSKRDENSSSVVLVVVNLDYRYKQSGWVDLSTEELGLNAERSYLAYDLLTDTAYQWHGPRNYVELDPQKMPAHIFQVLQRDDNVTQLP